MDQRRRRAARTVSWCVACPGTTDPQDHRGAVRHKQAWWGPVSESLLWYVGTVGLCESSNQGQETQSPRRLLRRSARVHAPDEKAAAER